VNVTFSADDLGPLVRAVVAEVLTELGGRFDGHGRVGYTEPEAAALLGVAGHVLRDCRLRGEIHARKLGRRYVYSRDELRRFLAEGNGETNLLE